MCVTRSLGDSLNIKLLHSTIYINCLTAIISNASSSNILSFFFLHHLISWFYRFTYNTDPWSLVSVALIQQIDYASEESGVANAPPSGRLFSGRTLEITWRRRYGGGNQSFRSVFRASRFRDARMRLREERRAKCTFAYSSRRSRTTYDASRRHKRRRRVALDRTPRIGGVFDKRRCSSSSSSSSSSFHRAGERRKMLDYRAVVSAEISFAHLAAHYGVTRTPRVTFSWWILGVQNWCVMHFREISRKWDSAGNSADEKWPSGSRDCNETFIVMRNISEESDLPGCLADSSRNQFREKFVSQDRFLLNKKPRSFSTLDVSQPRSLRAKQAIRHPVALDRFKNSGTPLLPSESYII